jgi:hypothetical protein
MNQDKTLVGPEIENLSNRRQVKMIKKRGGKSAMHEAIVAGIWQHAVSWK